MGVLWFSTLFVGPVVVCRDCGCVLWLCAVVLCCGCVLYMCLCGSVFVIVCCVLVIVLVCLWLCRCVRVIVFVFLIVCVCGCVKSGGERCQSTLAVEVRRGTLPVDAVVEVRRGTLPRSPCS